MKASEKSRRNQLLVLVLVLVVLHVLYSTEANKYILRGTYFASGTMIMSNGEVYDARTRWQSHDAQLNDFEQLNRDGQNFSLSQRGSFAGNARFVTDQERDVEWLKSKAGIDRDVAFNYAYLSAAFSRLTFYKLKVLSPSQCYYIKELDAVRCFGPERS